MHYHRRSVVQGLASVSLLSLASRTTAQTPIKLTLAHNLPPQSPKGMGASKFAELVAAKSSGRIDIHVAHSEQLGNENTNMSSIRTGTLDLGSLGQGALLSVAPEVAAIGLPFLFSTLPDAWAVLDGPVGQELAKRLEAKNIVFLGWWCNGIRQTTNNKRPINKPEDLKGLKIRTPLDPATVEMFSAMGATPQQISWGEVYLALQSGVVDGQENPLANISRRQALRGAEVHQLHQSQVRGDGADHEHSRLGPPVRGRSQAFPGSRRGGRRPPAQGDGGLGGEAARRVQEDAVDPDQQRSKPPRSRAATEVVWDEWEKKPFGDIVKKLRATRK